MGGRLKRSSDWTVTRMWYTPSGRLIPTTSVQKPSRFPPFRFPQEKQSGSVQAATLEQWITSSPLTTLTKQRSSPNGWTGPGRSDSSSSSQKTKRSQRRGSLGSSTRTRWSTNSSRWHWSPNLSSSTTGISLFQVPWSEELSLLYSYFAAVGDCADNRRTWLTRCRPLRQDPWWSTTRWNPQEDTIPIIDAVHTFLFRSLRPLLDFLSLSVKSPKQWERYTITNKASLSIYFYAFYFNLSQL